MIKFEVRKSLDAVKILDWSNVEFFDGEEDNRPVKCLTLKVSAGNVAEVIIERYLMAKDKDGYDITTINNKNEEELLTHKEFYCIEAEDIEDVIIKLVRTVKAKTFRDKPTESN
jgi:hypothetical protein